LPRTPFSTDTPQFTQSIDHTAFRRILANAKVIAEFKQSSTQGINIYWFFCHKELVKDHEVI